MNTAEALVLGILQGVTEWLPISSEGQTMLAMIAWLGISPSNALSYSIFLHLGTMAAVLLRFRREFLGMIEVDSKLRRVVLVSTLCTCFTGVPLYLLFKESFTSGREAMILIGALLMATGLMLRIKGSAIRGISDMTLLDMAILGLAQGFSILPGVSRSGTTLTVLLARGVKQDDALLISFVISVPAVLGAIALDGSLPAVTRAEAVMLVSSFIAGYITMDALIRFAKNISFSTFCLALGSLTLLFSMLM